jgi:hypothetical protein
MIDDWKSQCDPLRRRFGRILNIGHPTIFLYQKFVSREEGRRVAIWTNPEEDEIEHGETRRVFLRKFVDETFFICITEFFEVIKKSRVERVDVCGWERDMGEEGLVAKEVV